MYLDQPSLTTLKLIISVCLTETTVTADSSVLEFLSQGSYKILDNKEPDLSERSKTHAQVLFHNFYSAT